MAKSKKSKKDKKGKKGKAKGPPQAKGADKYECYEKSVQNPEYEVELLQKFFKNTFKREARVLREDFCGTHAVCCEWAKADPDNVAFGVDYDPEPLAWGEANNFGKLTPTQQKRVKTVEGDVRTAKTPKADLIAGMNFSYFIFKTRPELLRYFKAAHRNLKKEGLFALDIFGGHETFEDNREESHSVDGEFTYTWDQSKFDPITHDYTFYIHFTFKDGSKLKKAFAYHWRMWTIPEIRELLEEAGFGETFVYWEGAKKNGDGNGKFKRREHAPNDPAWVSYIMARK